MKKGIIIAGLLLAMANTAFAEQWGVFMEFHRKSNPEKNMSVNRAPMRLPIDVPTSSALAVDNGINPAPSIFLSNPNPSLSAFDGIKMENNTNHTCFSEECQSWIEGQIKTTISGPSTGFTGAKYTISNQIGQVEWTSSDASLATISNQGVLTVHGKGIVKIAASVNGVEYSKKIVVGMPTYVLSANHVPGGYMINANIISSQFKNYSSWINQVITFCWGVKYAGRDIKWVNGHSPSIMLPLEREADNATVYFKLIDNNGNESPMQFVNAVSSDLFFVNNNILSIDKSKNITTVPLKWTNRSLK